MTIDSIFAIGAPIISGFVILMGIGGLLTRPKKNNPTSKENYNFLCRYLIFVGLYMCIISTLSLVGVVKGHLNTFLMFLGFLTAAYVFLRRAWEEKLP